MTDKKRPKVYLAGPDVFRTDAKEHGRRLIQACDGWGFEGLYPLDNEVNITGAKYEDGRRIAKANRLMIVECDAVVANLALFRGPSADVGTVWECAYAYGLGKFVFGYGCDGVKYRDRVIGSIPHDGMIVEDFSAFDNIIIEHALDEWVQLFDDALRRAAIRLGTFVENSGKH